MKKTVSREIDIDTCNIFNEIDEVIKFLQDQKKKFPNKKLFVKDTTYSYDTTTAAIIYDDLETDKEYNARLELEHYKRLREEEKERELTARKERGYQVELEALKNKYGK